MTVGSVTWTLARESKEWVGPVTVTVSGVASTTFTLALLPTGTRPVSGDWATPDPLDNGRGVLVGPGTAHALPAGVYRLWARVLDEPELPVLIVGTLVIT